KAGKRDSVASIAKRYKVSAAQVASWNKVGVSAKLKRSQAIVVYVPAKAAREDRTLAKGAKQLKDKDDRKVSGAASKRSTGAANSKSGKAKTKVAAGSGKSQKVAKNTSRAKAGSGAPSRSGKVRVAAAR